MVAFLGLALAPEVALATRYNFPGSMCQAYWSGNGAPGSDEWLGWWAGAVSALSVDPDVGYAWVTCPIVRHKVTTCPTDIDVRVSAGVACTLYNVNGATNTVTSLGKRTNQTTGDANLDWNPPTTCMTGDYGEYVLQCEFERSGQRVVGYGMSE